MGNSRIKQKRLARHKIYLSENFDQYMVDLNLSVRAYHCLAAAQVCNRVDLLAHSPYTLSRIHEIGKVTLAEIVKAVEASGKHLNDDGKRLFPPSDYYKPPKPLTIIPVRELKNCPCCEGKPHLISDIFADNPLYSIYCERCDLRTPKMLAAHWAFEIWNKRPCSNSQPSTSHQDAFEQNHLTAP